MGHGHNTQNDMPSGFMNWPITIGGSILIAVVFLFVGISWRGPAACCEKSCKTECHGKAGGHGKEACCKPGEGGHNAAACGHTCGEECHKAGKCTHQCSAECKHHEGAAACGHVCGEECHKAGKCTHQCGAECKHHEGADTAKATQTAPEQKQEAGH